MEPAEIEKLIAEGFENPTVRVASDDNHHFEALVVAEEFLKPWTPPPDN